MTILQEQIKNIARGIKPSLDEICEGKLIPYNVITKIMALTNAADDLLTEVHRTEFEDN